MDASIRNRMISGTKVLWSTVIYVPALFIAILIATLLEPVLGPFEVERVERSWEKSRVLMIVVCGALLLVGRFFVWKPLRQLYVDIDDGPTFWEHSWDIARRAIPYAPFMALPIALLVFDIGGWFLIVQLGLIFAADKLFEQRRQRPIVASVDALLRRF